MRIPLIKPYITQEIKDKVCEALDSGYLTEGPVTKEFENAVRNYIGCEHSIAVTSCTTGLEIALRAVGVGPGDEVIVPDYTYPATADAVAIAGGTVVIVDVTEDTMLINYDALEAAITAKTRAIIPVSIFGNPLDYDRLNSIKHKHDVYVIEDAACSLGADFKGTEVGNLADISVFSLHPRKFITTGEGGVITTNNARWYSWMESYKHFGMGMNNTREGTVFERIGTNYKLSNVLAAIGLVQMNHIDELLNRRIELSENYLSLLKEHSDIVIPQTTLFGFHSRQSFCIYVENRDKIMQAMREAGVETQIGTYSLHMHPAFMTGEGCRIEGAMNSSRYSFDHCLTLPLYHEMTNEDQRYVVEELTKQVRICAA